MISALNHLTAALIISSTLMLLALHATRDQLRLVDIDAMEVSITQASVTGGMFDRLPEVYSVNIEDRR